VKHVCLPSFLARKSAEAGRVDTRSIKLHACCVTNLHRCAFSHWTTRQPVKTDPTHLLTNRQFLSLIPVARVSCLLCNQPSRTNGSLLEDIPSTVFHPSRTHPSHVSARYGFSGLRHSLVLLFYLHSVSCTPWTRLIGSVLF
jgi:hypothetical protein